MADAGANWGDQDDPKSPKAGALATAQQAATEKVEAAAANTGAKEPAAMLFSFSGQYFVPYFLLWYHFCVLLVSVKTFVFFFLIWSV